MKKSLLLCMMMLAAVVCMAKDIKTIVVTVTPQMHCENCEKKIKGNIRFEKGVKKIETSIPDQTVTIEYDADKISVDQLLSAFRKFGYEARLLEDGEKSEQHECGGCQGGCHKM